MAVTSGLAVSRNSYDSDLQEPRSAWALSWPLALAAVLFVWLVGANSTHLLADPDSHWPVTVGNWILAHGAVPTVDSYSFTFTAAGDYTYFCSLHPHMTGTIKVE